MRCVIQAIVHVHVYIYNIGRYGQKIDGGYKVKVGSVPHPMEEKHYIEWIELTADGKEYKKFLKPGQPAEAI
ncbi:MAG: desulfoferrodoxin family protein, partial [Thermoguttaceae bacterium]